MARFAEFVGPTYPARATQADAERCINFYLEKVETPGATKGEWILLSRPGLKAFSSFPGASSVQKNCAINGRGFSVAAGQFWEVFADGTNRSYGAVTPGARAVLCAGESQMLILSGGNGFLFTLATNTLAQITASGWIPGATQAANVDGYFVILEPNSQLFAISALNDGTLWNPLDFGDVEGQPGNVVAMIADHRQLYFLSNNHGEVYYDSGNALFPFTRLEGAFMDQGCGAIDSLIKIDNSIQWLGQNDDGAGIVWRDDGYTPERQSNHAIEALIESFGTISDASAYTYQEGGHTFDRLDFPSANGGLGATLVQDRAAQGMWHERTWLNPATGIEQADLARTHMYVFGKHLVGDYQSGTIYEQSMQYVTDDGNPIRRLRAAPDLSNGGKYAKYSELRLLTETGVGLDGAFAPGADPQMVMQYSNDGGKTWSNERPRPLGRIGKFKNLLRWRRLGRSNNRAFRVICTEPVFVAIIAADLDSK